MSPSCSTIIGHTAILMNVEAMLHVGRQSTEVEAVCCSVSILGDGHCTHHVALALPIEGAPGHADCRCCCLCHHAHLNQTSYQACSKCNDGYRDQVLGHKIRLSCLSYITEIRNQIGFCLIQILLFLLIFLQENFKALCCIEI